MTKRMITPDIMLSDALGKVSDTAFALYVVLMTLADDDGLVKAVRTALMMRDADKSYLEELIDSGLIAYAKDEDGPVWIMDWLIHNSIGTRAYKMMADSIYRDAIGVERNGRYTLTPGDDDMTIDEFRIKRANHTESKRKSEVKTCVERTDVSERDSDDDHIELDSYGLVRLSKTEYEKLYGLFQDRILAYIKQLSEYIRRTGHIQDDCYKALKKWAEYCDEHAGSHTDQEMCRALSGDFASALTD